MNVLALVFYVINFFFAPFVAQSLWGWFIAPIFGIATPSFALMVGLLLFVSWIRLRVSAVDQLPKEKTARDSELLSVTLQTFIMNIFVLLIGLVVQSFV